MPDADAVFLRNSPRAAPPPRRAAPKQRQRIGRSGRRRECEWERRSQRVAPSADMVLLLVLPVRVSCTHAFLTPSTSTCTIREQDVRLQSRSLRKQSGSVPHWRLGSPQTIASGSASASGAGAVEAFLSPE